MGKKIAFVATAYIKQLDGVSIYIENLLRELIKNQNFNKIECQLDIYVGEGVKALLQNRISVNDTSGTIINYIEVNDKNFYMKMFDLTKRLYQHGKYDLVFAANFMPLFFAPGPIVKIIYDLSPEVNPLHYSKFFKIYHAFLLRSGKWFDKSIAYISETTKHDLKKYYNIDESNKDLLFLPCGAPSKVTDLKRPTDKYMLNKYQGKDIVFLVVGRINHAKGYDRILEFCKYFNKALESENVDFDNVTIKIAGKQTSETQKLFSDKQFSNIHIDFLGYIDDETLNQNYIDSHFVFFLSRNEGYGLPLIEAMWLKSIPIISDIPIFHEITGEDFPKFSDKTGYTDAIEKFVVEIFSDRAQLGDIVGKIDKIVDKELVAYKVAAQNLAEYIENL